MNDTTLSRGSGGANSEIRFVPEDMDDIAVLDGHCQATGETRTDVMRALLKKWAAEEKHRAILICRTTGCNPFASESGRTPVDE